MADELHISSLVVHARPERAPAIRAAIAALPGCELRAEQAGKMIVVLETASESEILERIDAISALEGVLSAALVFHHVEQLAAAGEVA